MVQGPCAGSAFSPSRWPRVRPVNQWWMDGGGGLEGGGRAGDVAGEHQ